MQSEKGWTDNRSAAMVQNASGRSTVISINVSASVQALIKPRLTLFGWFELSDHQGVDRLDGYWKSAHRCAGTVPQRAKNAPLLCQETVNPATSSSMSQRSGLHDGLFVSRLHQGQTVQVAVTTIVHLVHQFMDQMNTKSADGSIFDGQ